MIDKIKELLFAVDYTFVTDGIGLPKNKSVPTQPSREIDADILEKLEKCRSANAVFSEFSVDAAIVQVKEMLYGKTSNDRRDASSLVLGYSQGKPINRSMSMTFNSADFSDEELVHDIRQLLAELGFQGGERTAAQIFMGTKRPASQVQARVIQAESGVSSELPEKHKAGEAGSSGESVGEDDDRGV